jgi:hypothetical protein
VSIFALKTTGVDVEPDLGRGLPGALLEEHLDVARLVICLILQRQRDVLAGAVVPAVAGERSLGLAPARVAPGGVTRPP